MKALSFIPIGIAAAALALSLGATSAKADLICIETGDGCTGAIPTAVPTLTVASDGEGGFDPFGAGFDTSDGIQLNANWAPDPAFAAAFAAGFWTDIGNFTWVLPASTPCGNENEPSCEPAARWYFTPGSPWNAGTPFFNTILEEDGSLSDIILLANNGPGGAATITFCSDPNVGACQVPEPASMAGCWAVHCPAWEACSLAWAGCAGVARGRDCRHGRPQSAMLSDAGGPIGLSASLPARPQPGRSRRCPDGVRNL